MKTVLLKLSGKALDDLFINDQWLNVLRNIKNSFDSLVIVHGAGIKISEWCWAMGREPKFLNGQRVTDEGTMEIVAAVQSGLLNAKFVSRLQSNKLNAIGLTGIDSGLFTAEYFNKDLGYVGTPNLRGNLDWLYSLMDNDLIPVFSSICRDEDGNLMNINADIFAKELAIAIHADTVLFLSDITGVKLNGSVQSILNEEEILDGIERGQITDGMIPKLQSCLDLIKSGIHKVWIGNDLVNQNFNTSSGRELIFENNLKGTWIVEPKAIAV